jgi:pyruvate/2-oxoglutarate/acetoin dehydrogenase E1 component
MIFEGDQNGNAQGKPFQRTHTAPPELQVCELSGLKVVQPSQTADRKYLFAEAERHP